MTMSPERIALPAIPEHKTEAGVYDPTAVIWNPPVKKQPGKVVVDETVQRVFRQAFGNDLAGRWNIALADPSHISVRKDGTKAIMDGQHTCYAADKNGVTSLHCIFHWGLSLEQEAAFHLVKQSERKTDYASDKWDLRVRANIPEYVVAKKMLAKHGLVVGSHIRAAGAVDYVVSNFGTQAMENVVLTVNAWSNGKTTRDSWANAVIRALGFLYGNQPHVADPVKLGKKLAKKGTTPESMAQRIAAVAKGGGGSGSRTRIGASLIAQIWNVRVAPANQFLVGALGIVGSEDGDDDDE